MTQVICSLSNSSKLRQDLIPMAENDLPHRQISGVVYGAAAQGARC